MAKTQYVALLRGINVGGGNIIKGMQPRKRCHVYSKRNVVFETQPDGAKLVRKLEQALSRTFSPYTGRIVVCSHARLRRIVREAPKGFGSRPQQYRDDVIAAFIGPDVLYFSRLIAKASQSRLTRIVALPVYQDMTIRNWNTTRKILALMDARASM